MHVWSFVVGFGAGVLAICMVICLIGIACEVTTNGYKHHSPGVDL